MPRTTATMSGLCSKHSEFSARRRSIAAATSGSHVTRGPALLVSIVETSCSGRAGKQTQGLAWATANWTRQENKQCIANKRKCTTGCHYQPINVQSRTLESVRSHQYSYLGSGSCAYCWVVLFKIVIWPSWTFWLADPGRFMGS